MEQTRGHIVLASGGTGGHIFPARALAGELRERGYQVTLMTDERGERYEEMFPGATIKQIKAGSPSLGGLPGKVTSVFKLGVGLLQSIMYLRQIKPDAVVGFGGYPSLPPTFAASLLKIPLLLHEQNAILGRVNRLLARRANCIATSFAYTDTDERNLQAKMSFTGNPVRREIQELHGTPYRCVGNEEPVNLLITGGSQGAKILSDVVPVAVSLLDKDLQARLHITQQCRAEDIDQVRSLYANTASIVVLDTFFSNMPELLANCHLAIGRSGASTMAELAAAGRPAILVPYKFAMDDHQTKNARCSVDLGAAVLIAQDDFTPELLSSKLKTLLECPDKLKTMALATANSAEIGAAAKLADLVERFTGNRTSRSIKSGKVVA
ncbi:undecaprenyldiphospho-muramoylpentapeptide beta-N-acetylglucosaminyltransferase [Sneathiella glossodoripedis]|uniref:undecaprenyldiphospho-muramoylpentapeptide beta-N-acetylglucosaminyltransferase n=1 Tax=Sneathiella glossodoripedis TaxID=418853 RepID=UPI0004727D15|nr:undecaprenyldiphospho-muramoylpentapeptide beta-N-acetylglucosaminyltransferase [Sneathiella glossodoripedis]